MRLLYTSIDIKGHKGIYTSIDIKGHKGIYAIIIYLYRHKGP